jgi:hypothetical protein
MLISPLLRHPSDSIRSCFWACVELPRRASLKSWLRLNVALPSDPAFLAEGSRPFPLSEKSHAPVPSTQVHQYR